MCNTCMLDSTITADKQELKKTVVDRFKLPTNRLGRLRKYMYIQDITYRIRNSTSDPLNMKYMSQ
jgi:hypothetical protein